MTTHQSYASVRTGLSNYLQLVVYTPRITTQQQQQPARPSRTATATDGTPRFFMLSIPARTTRPRDASDPIIRNNCTANRRDLTQRREPIPRATVKLNAPTWCQPVSTQTMLTPSTPPSTPTTVNIFFNIFTPTTFNAAPVLDPRHHRTTWSTLHGHDRQCLSNETALAPFAAPCTSHHTRFTSIPGPSVTYNIYRPHKPRSTISTVSSAHLAPLCVAFGPSTG